MSLSPANESTGRTLFGWRKPKPAPEEEPALPEVGREDLDAPLVTRTEAARALLYAVRAGIETVVIDATPDDWTPPECLTAHGRRLPTSVAWTNQALSGAGALPHETEGASPCRCRYRAAAPATLDVPEPRPIDAEWSD